MLPITSEQCGDMLALWLEKSSSPEAVKQVVRDAGYNDSPFFGAEKKRTRVIGELVMANTALAILAVNQVFGPEDAKAIIDVFLSAARRSVFTFLEARDSTFEQRYEQRLTEYFKIFGEKQPLLGMSFAFMQSLDLDPLKQGPGQLHLAERFGRSLNETVDVLRRMDVSGAASGNGPAPLSPKAIATVPTRTAFFGMIDVDNFDVLNEKLGRAAGDQVMLAYKRLAAAHTRVGSIVNETGFMALQDELARTGKTLNEFVLCFPYASGDEFLIQHPDPARVRSALESMQRAAEELELAILDGSGATVAVLHGLPVSVGSGRTRNEAWKAVTAQKQARTRKAMGDRIEVLGEPRRGAPPTQGGSADVRRSIFRDRPATDPATRLPTTIEVTIEESPQGPIPVLMWGPVETRRPGWTKIHHEKMCREIVGHMASLGISDSSRFKETTEEVAQLSSQIWTNLVQAVAKARSKRE